MTLNEIAADAHYTAVSKGWWKGRTQFDATEGEYGKDIPDPAAIPELLCLVHSEVSEALEAYRDGNAPSDLIIAGEGKPEGIPAELADVIIRIADIAGAYGIDLDEAVRAKLAYNRTRSHRHGGKLA